jgi:hypothetical protein
MKPPTRKKWLKVTEASYYSVVIRCHLAQPFSADFIILLSNSKLQILVALQKDDQEKRISASNNESLMCERDDESLKCSMIMEVSKPPNSGALKPGFLRIGGQITLD